MDVLTNGRALAIAVGESLALPSGRLVRLADINADAWEPADANPEDATPECLATAMAEAARLAALPPPPPRVLPEGEAFRPLTVDPSISDFLRRAEALMRVLAPCPTRTTLVGYCEKARMGIMTDGMWTAIEQLEEAADPSHVAAFASELDALSESFAGTERANIARNAAENVRTLGFTTKKLRALARSLRAQVGR